MKSLPELPQDIIKIIINYVDDIDIRRHFNIYRKINLDNFKILNSVMRKRVCKKHGNFTRYHLYNKHSPSFRRLLCHPNDFMDVVIHNEKDTIKYIINICRLLKKRENEIITQELQHKKWKDSNNFNTIHFITYSSVNDEYKYEFVSSNYNI
tara:strand:+ start:114 stop:569 length:456 start_codon:yes stop_codon:yes gene_type:complete